jgi:hypothetical protein
LIIPIVEEWFVEPKFGELCLLKLRMGGVGIKNSNNLFFAGLVDKAGAKLFNCSLPVVAALRLKVLI